MKSILNTLDILLGHLAAWIMTFLLYISFGAIAVIYLIFIPFSFFEYGVNINELDLTEVSIFALLLLVIWRFFRRGISQKWSYWQLVRRFVYTVTVNALIVISCLFFMLISMLVTAGKVELSALYNIDETTNFVSSLMMLISIYAAAPLSPFFYKETHDASLIEPSSQKETESVTYSASDGDKSTGSGGFEENLKNFRAPENPWEKV